MAQEYLLLDILLWFSIYLIVALSLNVEYGYAGIPNFGRALAVLVGAIAVGGVVNRILISMLGIEGGIIEASGSLKGVLNPAIAQNPLLGLGILLLCLAVAALLGAITGALFILPSAKLRHDYLAITLLAISEVMFLVANYNTSIIGGYYGVSVPDVLAFVPGERRFLGFALLALALALVVYLLVERLLTSPYGRLLKAMRENEDVVRAFGRNILVLRIKTVAIGSAIAALAGAFYSLYSVNVIASTFFRVDWTFFPFLMLLLGGMGNNRGVVLGVLSFVVLKVLLIVYKYEIKAVLHLPFEATWLEYMLFGVLMLLILYYKPEGLVRERPLTMTPPIRSLAQKSGERSGR
ncbi:MAG: branched-chain amino acid ABC transporter permease [Euryarchaeota archaeon]|nr:branched-chain amino acid ABC transporter permease [Euryarchaeota archaeon]